MRTSLARPQFGLPAALISPVLSLLLIAGCGGGSSSSGTGGGGGGGTTAKTNVAIQVSSKANGMLSQYTASIQSITLTGSSGSVTIPISYPNASSNGVNIDFTAANGEAYPVTTAQVTQGTYTSASVSYAAPGFVHVYGSSNGPVAERQAGTSNSATANVTVPSPITISSTPVGLTLSLDTSASVTLSNPTGSNSFSGAPNLTLTAFNISSASTTPANGKCIGLSGQLTAASSSSITANLTGNGFLIQQNAGYQVGVPVTAALNSSTVYQGSVHAASDLKTGQFVNFDLALQTDGSYAVTRVEVDDTTATNMTSGMVMTSAPVNSAFADNPLQFEGTNIQATTNLNLLYFNSASAKFQISPSVSTSSLPFTPTFTAATLVPGQNVAIGATGYTASNGGLSTANSVTLVPQTIDAKITAGPTTNGSYSVYTVQLASYDPIVQTNTSAGVTGLQLGSSAATVQVYVGPSTAKLGSSTLATGGTFRFHGLLFDDNGSLAMVADQYNDGVNQ